MRLRYKKLSKLQNVSVFINLKLTTAHRETIFNWMCNYFFGKSSDLSWNYMSQICSRSVQLFGFFPTFLNLWPYNLLQIRRAPRVSRGYFFSLNVHSEMNMHTCAKCGPDRSNGLRQDSRCLLWLVRFLDAVGADSRKDTPKNNICTSKIIIPAWTCWHHRH